VFLFTALDCLKIPRLEGAGNFPHVWGVVFPGRSGRFVILATEDTLVGGLPRFGIMGRPGYWRGFHEDRYQTVQRF